MSPAGGSSPPYEKPHRDVSRERAGDGLALFGGAFNPPHGTHRRIAEAALAQLPVSDLRVVPCGDHPFKGDRLEAARHRLRMCELTFAGLHGVGVSDIEVRSAEVSYTVSTLRQTAGLQPGRPLYWILGSDNLLELPSWREHHEILRLATVATYPRAGAPVTAERLAELDFTPGERHTLLRHVLAVEPDAVSATDVREALAAGRAESADVTPAVLEYIRQHHLYGT